MVRYYISSSVNWADEMDLPYGHVYSAKEYKEAIKYVKNLIDKLGSDKSFDMGVGTNEDIELTLGDVLSDLENAEKITDSEYKVLRKFSLSNFGPDFYESLWNHSDIEEAAEEFDELEKQRIAESKRKLTPAEKIEKARKQKCDDFRSFLSK